MFQSKTAKLMFIKKALPRRTIVMSKKHVEELLIKGGDNPKFREKYNLVPTAEGFVALAAEDGYEFTVEELMDVVNESGDSFATYGNPPKRSIWWT